MKKHITQKINIITLGCSKNLVDSEVLLTQIEAANINVVHNENDSDARTVIINTCGFINDAKQESIDVILSAVRAKEEGLIDNVFVMGCLSERYKDELKKEISEVDEYFGVNDLKELLGKLHIDYKKDLLGDRKITTPKHYAYLKISEGCSRSCSFCAIPLIRGKHISQPIDKLVLETQSLVERGVKEIILIAQDLSFYGKDLYGEFKLKKLLKKLCQIEGLEWIRLHYAYPAHFPMDVIPFIKDNPKICKYLDIPIQHISDHMLKAMRRGHDRVATIELIKHLRSEIPEMAIRTTLLVGHPNETEADFAELMAFVEEIRFDRLGVFAYSPEEGTYAAENYEDNISEKVKQKRADKIMELQQKISNELNVAKIGKVYKVLIDNKLDDVYVGRTEFDSPEVDNEVLIQTKGKKLKLGTFYKVKITDATEFDLYGEIAD